MTVFPLVALVALLVAPAWAQDAPFRSALDAYQPFKDAEIAPWKDANDTVRQVGGWRAYAREAAAPAPGASNAGGPASAGATGPRAGAPAPAPAPAPAAGAHKH